MFMLNTHSRAFISLLACATSQIACGAATTNQGLFVEAEFQPYLTEFQAELDKHDTKIKIKNLTITSDDHTEKLGNCHSGGNKPPVIQINMKYWKELSSTDKEALMLHELGHCILGRPHTTNMVPNRAPGAEKVNGSGICLNNTLIPYTYKDGAEYVMPASLMHPCSGVASNMYSFMNTDPEFVKAMKQYYIKELIDNRVVGFDSGF